MVPTEFIMLLFIIITFIGSIETKPKPTWQHKGSTPILKEIVVGRCHQYLQLSTVNRRPSFTLDVDCNALWASFKSAWAGKDNCDVRERDFDGFFSLIHKEEKVDSLLFYSSLHDLSQDFTQNNKNFISLERTISGYMMDRLKFCGCTEESSTCVGGISYDDCRKCSQGKGASHVFWKVASENFAKRAKGTCYVMLNGSKPEDANDRAWRSNKSFFTDYELPELKRLGQQGVLKKMVILVVSDLDKSVRESCSNKDGSVYQLIKLINGTFIKDVKCIDDPSMIVNLLCAKHCGEIVRNNPEEECKCPEKFMTRKTARQEALLPFIEENLTDSNIKVIQRRGVQYVDIRQWLNEHEGEEVMVPLSSLSAFVHRRRMSVPTD